uniref:Uncharacterized protein n=1 Tax=Virus NIOZ-UU157 TaxID=2763269 RepID=A0A7S9SSK5_9VIRU|nr:MAG: hypothetical protein NIOZUU157_00360 [Virus NIOZ-UU157]
MKAEFLKMAGVKSEAEFYKKFPSEDAFMAKHGKAVKKLMVKKANIGAMIQNKQAPTSNRKPTRIDDAFLYDTVASQMGKESYDEMMAKMKAEAQAAAGQQSGGGGGGGMGGMMAMLPQIMSMMGGAEGAGGAGGAGDMGAMMSGVGLGKHGSKISKDRLKKIEGELHKASKMHKGQAKRIGKMLKGGGSVEKFEPHMMYDPKTKKGKKVKTLKEHLALKKKGWSHDAPKAQGGTVTPSWGQGIDLPQGEAYSSPGNQFFGIQEGASGMDQASNIFNSDAVQNFGIPIVSDIMKISDQLKQQKEGLARAKQNRMLTELTLDAAKSEPEKIDREYVRPEDIQNTGEEFFPIYGVGTNVLAKHGGAYKAQDGGMFTGEYMPLVDPNQQKQFRQGGALGSNSYLVPKAQGGFNMANISYGGGASGGLGQDLSSSLFGGGTDAGSNIGGTIGSTIGSAFGPIGGAVGGFIGSGIGDLVDRDDRRTRKENERAERATKELSYTAIAPAVQAGYASHVREGGNISSNPSMLETMKMGGELKTLWGGEAETVSYNPYAGGESIQFKGNSHDYRDPKTGQTGIGVAYGQESIANNEAVVEVENEPAQQLKDGGGAENLVVYGDLKIPEEFVSEIGDDRAKGKKFKNYVSDVLNKDELKANKRMEKAADLGLESDNTVFGQLERTTADAILKGSDMKLKSIAEKKNILADLQSALNETFDELEIKGNEFIQKGKMVNDPERSMNNMAKSGIEIKPENKGKFTAWAKERGMSVSAAANKVMANKDDYSEGVVAMANFAKNARKFKKGEEGVTVTETTTDGNFNKQLGGDKILTTDKSPEELLEDKWVRDENNPNLFTRKKGDDIEAVQLSGNSLGYTPPGQSIDQETGLAGGITMEQIAKLESKNPWFGKFDLTKPKVKYDGKMVHPDVLRFQKEFNKRVEGTDIKKIQKIDGVLGQETFGAEFTPPVEGKEAEVEKVKVAETTTETTTIAQGFPLTGYQPRVEGEPLDPNQLLGEYAALSSNTLVPAYAQTYQPKLRVPYDISLQDMKNDVIAQNRALQRNPALANNPAAAALTQAPTYAALNKINAEEFRQNQAMKDSVYSGNTETINRARLTNLGIYDQQQDRQQQAVANTKATTIAALNSISSKYQQKQLETRLKQTFANLYPTYGFDDDYRARVQQSGSFNVNGQTISGIPGLATPGFNPALLQIPGVLGQMQQLQQQQQQFIDQQDPINYNKIDRVLNRDLNNTKDIYDYQQYEPIDGAYAKKGKTIKKKNYKKGNILKDLRNL